MGAMRRARMDERQASGHTSRQGASSSQERVLLIRTARRLVVSRIRMCAEPSYPSVVVKLARMDELLVNQAPPHQERSLSLVHVLLIRIARPLAVKRIKTSAGRFFP